MYKTAKNVRVCPGSVRVGRTWLSVGISGLSAECPDVRPILEIINTGCIKILKNIFWADKADILPSALGISTKTVSGWGGHWADIPGHLKFVGRN